MTRVWLSVLAAVLVLSVAWWFLFYGPAREQQAALEQQTADLQTQQAQLRTQLAQLEEIREQEVAIRADLARLQEFIPSTPSQAALVRQLQQAADASGVTIEAMNFAEPVVVEGAPPPAEPGLVLGVIASQVTLEGGFFQATDFLRRIEVDVARAMLVQDVMIDESDLGFPRLTIDVTGSVFALITPPVDPTAPQIDAEVDADDDGDIDGAAENAEEAQEAEAADGGNAEQVSAVPGPAEVSVR